MTFVLFPFLFIQYLHILVVVRTYKVDRTCTHFGFMYSQMHSNTKMCNTFTEYIFETIPCSVFHEFRATFAGWSHSSILSLSSAQKFHQTAATVWQVKVNFSCPLTWVLLLPSPQVCVCVFVCATHMKSIHTQYAHKWCTDSRAYAKAINLDLKKTVVSTTTNQKSSAHENHRNKIKFLFGEMEKINGWARAKKRHLICT